MKHNHHEEAAKHHEEPNTINRHISTIWQVNMRRQLMKHIQLEDIMYRRMNMAKKQLKSILKGTRKLLGLITSGHAHLSVAFLFVSNLGSSCLVFY